MVKLLTLYAIGAEKDHIVPWDAASRIQQLVAGKTRYVLASSGHIAGIINAPGGKGSYWTNDDVAVTSARLRGSAHRHEGSWWTTGLPGSPPAVVPRGHPLLGEWTAFATAGRSRQLRPRELVNVCLLGDQIRGRRSTGSERCTSSMVLGLKLATDGNAPKSCHRTIASIVEMPRSADSTGDDYT